MVAPAVKVPSTVVFLRVVAPVTFKVPFTLVFSRVVSPVTVKPPLRLARPVAVKVPPTSVLPVLESMLVSPTVRMPPVIFMPLKTVNSVNSPPAALTIPFANSTPLILTLSSAAKPAPKAPARPVTLIPLIWPAAITGLA